MAAVLTGNDDERDRAIAGTRAAPAPTVPDNDPMEVLENADGSATVSLPKVAANESGFGDNLADALTGTTELSLLETDLLRLIEHDKESRRRRDEQYAEGLRRTGLGDDAPGGAQFSGASKAVHPMLAEAAIDFSASAMRELFPPAGPVRTEIFGEQTPEKMAIADRQYKYMNWQLTEQIEEYPEELEQTLTQLPMGGSQYMKFWPDESENRPMCQFCPVDDVIVPYACTSFWSAHRITHVQRLSESEWDERVDNEMYLDVEESPPSTTPTPTKTAKANEKIEGVDEPSENLDGLRIVYEVNTFLKLSIDKDKRLPYLVSICERTNRICSIYRNWEEGDRRKKRLHWIVDFGFIPWRGAIKLGLPQLIGGLSAAATGALRALLDSALVNTLPVLAKLKAAKMGGQAKTLDPMTAIEIDAGTSVDDIRKAMMALPFNAPSPVLFQLLGWLTDAAKGVVTTAEEKISEATNQMPMGTALALIEQGAKVFSSIHARLHRSQKKALAIIARINKSMVDEESQVEKFGEVICTKEDFKRPLGVVPVSDPNIYSEGQRYAQMHLVQDMMAKYPQLHNPYEVIKSSYKLAKIPDIDTILPPPKQPTELNAAAENASVMLGNPIMAFPEQEHYAHLETHMRFILDPLLGGNPAAIPNGWPKMLEHIKQHLAFLYAKTMHDLASEELGKDVGEMLKDKKNYATVDKLMAAASKIVHAQLNEILQPLGPTVQTMLQKIEQFRMPPPMDPSAAAMQIAQIEDKRKREEAGANNQLSGAELEAKKKKDAADAEAKAEANRIASEKNLITAGGIAKDHAVAVASHELDVSTAAQDTDLQRQQHVHTQRTAEDAHELEVASHHQKGAQFAEEQAADERRAAEAQAQAEAQAAAAAKKPTGGSDG